MFEKLIQDRLAAMLGVDVVFGHLDLAPFRGAVSASDVRITAHSAPHSILHAAALRGEISPAALLRREVDVQEITIDRPHVTVIRDEAGAWNLPQRRPRAELGEATASGKSASHGFEVSIHNASAVEGVMELIDRGAGAIITALRALGVAAELSSHELVHRFTITSEQVEIVSHGETSTLGLLAVHGELRGAALTNMRAASLKCEVTLGEIMRAAIDVPTIGDRSITAAVKGELDMTMLRRLIPPNALPAAISHHQWTGRCRFECDCDFDPVEGLRVREFALSGRDLRLS